MLSLTKQVGKKEEHEINAKKTSIERGKSHPGGHHHHHHDDNSSEVTVDCGSDDDDYHEYIHFSLYAIILRLLEAMTRYTPAAVQALVQSQVHRYHGSYKNQ